MICRYQQQNVYQESIFVKMKLYHVPVQPIFIKKKDLKHIKQFKLEATYTLITPLLHICDITNLIWKQINL